MNKKYISTGVFIVVVVIGAGITYYFYPTVIDNALGIDSAQPGAVADADLSALDDGSSSFSLSGSGTDAAAALLAPSSSSASAKKVTQKNNGVAKNGAAAAQADASQGQPIVPQGQAAVSSPAQGESDTSDTGNASDTFDDAAVAATSSAPSSVPVASSVPAASCSFPGDAPATTTRTIIFNEIAWMGSPSSSIAEWMEVKNISTDEIDLAGWELLNASGKIKISFPDGDAIAPGGLLLLSRGSAGVNTVAGAASVSAAKTYSGDLVNAGDVLALMDPQCAVSDYLDASHGWPGGNNTTKATLERNADGIGWHTSALPGGTPGAENSAGPPPAQYKLSIAFEGNAAGATITGDPAGISCGASCTGSFASGTQITLTPAAGPNTVFSEWSGLCYGETVCSFTIAANTSLTAEFRSTLATTSIVAENDASPLSAGIATSTTSASTTDSGSGGEDNGMVATSTDDASGTGTNVGTTGANHILIAAVQIAGVSSSNDLVKLYNPTGAAVDTSGWKLHKKSQTGADYSLKEFPTGSVIAAGQSFVWANSAGGFSETVGANVSSTETLAADNSVALMDAAGNIIDAVAWGTGSGQYGEGPPYPTDPSANQLLTRRSSDGVMVDTDNNTNDFILQ
jgi:hypothetical protein